LISIIADFEGLIKTLTSSNKKGNVSWNVFLKSRFTFPEANFAMDKFGSDKPPKMNLNQRKSLLGAIPGVAKNFFDRITWGIKAGPQISMIEDVDSSVLSCLVLICPFFGFVRDKNYSFCSFW
jgi:hypothetical protein